MDTGGDLIDKAGDFFKPDGAGGGSFMDKNGNILGMNGLDTGTVFKGYLFDQAQKDAAKNEQKIWERGKWTDSVSATPVTTNKAEVKKPTVFVPPANNNFGLLNNMSTTREQYLNNLNLVT